MTLGVGPSNNLGQSRDHSIGHRLIHYHQHFLSCGLGHEMAEILHSLTHGLGESTWKVFRVAAKPFRQICFCNCPEILLQ